MTRGYRIDGNDLTFFVRLNLQIPHEMWADLSKLSGTSDVPIDDLIRRAIAEFLERHL